MLQTLRTRILFYLLLVSLSGIVLVSFAIQVGFETSFKDYLNENRLKKINLVEEEIKQEYQKSGNYANDRIVNLMHEQAMTENLFYRILDSEGKVKSESTSLIKMMKDMAPNLALDGKMNSSSYELSIDKKKIGSVQVFYPVGLIDEEFTFLQTIQQYIFIIVAVTIILSFLFSMLFSKKLASGFNRFAHALKELQNHNLSVRIPEEAMTDEMKSLGHAINNLAESLAREELLRKQFTGDLAHELRTPLATLRSQIEAFKDGIWEPTPKRLQQSHDELMRLVRLVNELEKLLAAENPQIRLQKTELEAGKVLSSIEDQFRPSFQEKGVHLHILHPEQKHWFNADPDRLTQILTNIINNAFKYTPKGKKITISVIEKEEKVGFQVKDEGIGISPEDLPHIFERFYRGDKSRDRKTGGIGIGLSIVKALVEAHHGEIEIESNIDEGTNLKVYFPKK